MSSANPNRLWRSVSFRLTLAFMGLFYLAFMLLGSFIYWRTAIHLDSEIRGLVDSTLQDAVDYVVLEAGLAELQEEINERVERDPNGVATYVLFDNNCRAVAGSLHRRDTITQVQNACKSGLPATEWIRYTESLNESALGSQEFVGRLQETRDGYALFYGRSIAELEDTKSLLATALFWGFLILLLLGGSAGVLMARVVSGRLEQINRISRNVREGDLSQRIRVDHAGDEFGRLAINLNEMMDQIQQLMEGVREVSNSIAHDLRTPLTRLRNHLEALRAKDLPTGDREIKIDQATAEADNLLSTFSALLRIAQLESGGSRAEFSLASIDRVIADVVELYEPLATERDKSLSFGQQAGVTLRMDCDLLFQAICNLVDNAVKHTPPGTSIYVASSVVDGLLEIEVCDDGEGIPTEFRDKVLERFYRRESHRGTTGSGLGLSLVAAVANLHGGNVRFEDNDPGLRAVLTVLLDK